MSKNNYITCSTCKKIKKDTEFIKSDHLYFKTCNDCRLYAKTYYKQNKTDILKGKYEKTRCKCGSTVSRGNLTNHQRSLKHQRFLTKPKEKEVKDKYHYTFWESKIHGVTYYYQSKTKTKMIKCPCGVSFYPNQIQFDKHIMSSHHLYFEDILRHSKPYDDEYVIYEKYNF